MVVPGLGLNLHSVREIHSEGSQIQGIGNPHAQVDRIATLPLNQHPEDQALCLRDIPLRALGGTIETTPTLPRCRPDDNTPTEQSIRAEWTEACGVHDRVHAEGRQGHAGGSYYR